MSDFAFWHRRNWSRFPFIMAVLLAGLLVGIEAPPSEAKLDATSKCRGHVANSVRRAATAVLKARSECTSQRIRWVLGESVNCLTDPDILGGDGTGDLKTDEKLAKVSDIINRHAAKISLKCSDKATPLGAGVEGLCTPAEPADWSAVTRCAGLEVGKAAGDSLAQLLSVARPTDGPQLSVLSNCYNRVSRKARTAEKKLNRYRADCFRMNDELGGDALECSATNAAPGIVQTTGNAKLYKDLSQVFTSLRRAVYDACDLDLGTLGFPQSVGGNMPDHTGGSFSAEDLFTVVADALHQEIM